VKFFDSNKTQKKDMEVNERRTEEARAGLGALGVSAEVFGKLGLRRLLIEDGVEAAAVHLREGEAFLVGQSGKKYLIAELAPGGKGGAE
jgi:hypothetical protein